MNVKETLEAARKVFVERGGAVGQFEDDDGRVCAIGALKMVCVGDPNGIPETGSQYWDSRRALSDATLVWYGDSIADVNDNLGRDAVLACYDATIEAVS